ncbi:Txe/YoeB family addiction module toxin [Phenylobacterium sp.]|uniref:Txe/YoeB family addiction module toxin n=1 Tax=Phenylobacterium sp. TaxID=1871053 RepID=UPI00301CA087
MRIIFADRAWEDYLHWQATDPSTLVRLNSLIRECTRTPFRGIGKPELLKGDFRGWWSRRITQEDRLVYRVASKGADQHLEIAQCRMHY